MTYVPLNRNVIVERKEPEKVSAGGIILHSSLEPDRAIVVATGDDSISIGEVLSFVEAFSSLKLSGCINKKFD